jgi:L-rhamnose mutarotase
MRNIMPANPDDSPVSRDLREVFQLDGRSREPRV